MARLRRYASGERARARASGAAPAGAVSLPPPPRIPPLVPPHLKVPKNGTHSFARLVLDWDAWRFLGRCSSVLLVGVRFGSGGVTRCTVTISVGGVRRLIVGRRRRGGRVILWTRLVLARERDEVVLDCAEVHVHLVGPEMSSDGGAGEDVGVPTVVAGCDPGGDQVRDVAGVGWGDGEVALAGAGAVSMHWVGDVVQPGCEFLADAVGDLVAREHGSA